MTRRGGEEWSQDLRGGFKSGQDETGARWIPPGRHEKVLKVPVDSARLPRGTSRRREVSYTSLVMQGTMPTLVER